MHVVAFNGSPRKNGNTARLVRHCLDTLEAEGISTEIVQVGGTNIRGCCSCLSCRKNGVEVCSITSDPFNEWIEKMKNAEGIILASPVYMFGTTPEMKALIDRASFIARGRVRRGEQGSMFYRKVGGAISAVRRAGAIQALQTMISMFAVTQMIVPMSNYWTFGMGEAPGEVEQDAEGWRCMEELGRNMAWVMKKLHA